MPYEFNFRRITILDNKSALESNISLAKELTDSCAEIVDANTPSSDFYFTKTVIDTSKEFPEQHFYLEADIESFFYHFSFWKDFLCIEFGAGGDVARRFKHLRDYSKIILNHGFQIEAPWGNELLAQDIGFEKHVEEYCKWVSFVDYVRHHIESSD